MKQLLIFFFLMPSMCFAQFVSYEQDVRKVNRTLDKNDRKKKAILEESLAIMDIMLKLTYEQIGIQENKEDLKINQATYQILVSIYKNTNYQISLFEERVNLSKDIEENLNDLADLQSTSKNNYQIYRKKIGFQNNLNRYKRVYRDSEREQRLLSTEIREHLNNVSEQGYSKNLVENFIYSLTIKGIEKFKIKPIRDSLNTIIDSTELHITKLTQNRDILKASLENLKKESIEFENQNYELTEKIDQLVTKSTKIKAKEVLLEKEAQKLATSLIDSQNKLSEKTQALKRDSASLADLTKKMIKTEKELDLKIDSLSLLEEKNKSFSVSNDSLANIKLAHENEIASLKNQIEGLGPLKQRKNQLLLFSSLSLVAIMGFGYRLKQSKDMAKVQTMFLKKLKVSNRQLKDKTAELRLSHKELQHRTKNNLQKIINLIYLKKFSIKDKQARGILEVLQNELDTIALIHQKLYVKENQKLTTVNVADYVDELVRYIVGDAAIIQTNVEDIYIEMDNAVEIGLILNELVTNACKYGLNKVVKPEICLNIYVQDEFIFIKLRDNGIGFPEDISIAKHASFGLMAIADIVKRHKHKGSDMHLFNDNGAVVALQLPFDKSKGRLAA